MTLITPTKKTAKRAIAALKLADKGWHVETCCGPNYETRCRRVTNGDDHFVLISTGDGVWTVEER